MTRLLDQRLIHRLPEGHIDTTKNDAAETTAEQFTLDRYTENVFYGIVPDTRAADLSTAG